MSYNPSQLNLSPSSSLLPPSIMLNDESLSYIVKNNIEDVVLCCNSSIIKTDPTMDSTFFYLLQPLLVSFYSLNIRDVRDVNININNSTNNNVINNIEFDNINNLHPDLIHIYNHIKLILYNYTNYMKNILNICEIILLKISILKSSCRDKLLLTILHWQNIGNLNNMLLSAELYETEIKRLSILQEIHSLICSFITGQVSSLIKLIESNNITNILKPWRNGILCFPDGKLLDFKFMSSQNEFNIKELYDFWKSWRDFIPKNILESNLITNETSIICLPLLTRSTIASIYSIRQIDTLMGNMNQVEQKYQAAIDEDSDDTPTSEQRNEIIVDLLNRAIQSQAEMKQKRNSDNFFNQDSNEDDIANNFNLVNLVPIITDDTIVYDIQVADEPMPDLEDFYFHPYNPIDQRCFEAFVSDQRFVEGQVLLNWLQSSVVETDVPAILEDTPINDTLTPKKVNQFVEEYSVFLSSKYDLSSWIDTVILYVERLVFSRLSNINFFSNFSTEVELSEDQIFNLQYRWLAYLTPTELGFDGSLCYLFGDMNTYKTKEKLQTIADYSIKKFKPCVCIMASSGTSNSSEFFSSQNYFVSLSAAASPRKSPVSSRSATPLHNARWIPYESPRNRITSRLNSAPGTPRNGIKLNSFPGTPRNVIRPNTNTFPCPACHGIMVLPQKCAFYYDNDVPIEIEQNVTTSVLNTDTKLNIQLNSPILFTPNDCINTSQASNFNKLNRSPAWILNSLKEYVLREGFPFGEAINILHSLNFLRVPADILDCFVRTLQTINAQAQTYWAMFQSSQSDDKPEQLVLDADTLFPIVLWVVIHSDIHLSGPHFILYHLDRFSAAYNSDYDFDDENQRPSVKRSFACFGISNYARTMIEASIRMIVTLNPSHLQISGIGPFLNPARRKTEPFINSNPPNKLPDAASSKPVKSPDPDTSKPPLTLNIHIE